MVLRERGLPRAVGPDQSDELPAIRMEVHAVQQRLPLDLVGEVLRADCLWSAAVHSVLLGQAERGVGRLRELLRPENPGEVLGASDVPVGQRGEVFAFD